MTGKKYQRFSEEFRKRAVIKSEQPGMTQSKVADELGITAKKISCWKQQFKQRGVLDFDNLDHFDFDAFNADEKRRLRQENKRLAKEVEFLKKVVAHASETAL